MIFDANITSKYSRSILLLCLNLAITSELVILIVEFYIAALGTCSFRSTAKHLRNFNVQGTIE